MSEAFSINKRRMVIRLALLALLVLIGIGLFYIGKEHEVLLDNKNAAIDGKDYEAAPYIRVTVDGNSDEAVELYAGERDVVKVSGLNHTIKVEVIDEDSEKVLKSEERSFNFGSTSMFMISLPALAEKAGSVYLPLPDTYVETAATEESITSVTGEQEHEQQDEQPPHTQ